MRRSMIRMPRAAGLAAALLLAGWGGASAQGGSAFPKVTPAEVAGWQDKGAPFLLIDVRPTAMYDVKHARGAINVPAFAVERQSLPRAAKIVVYDAGAGATEAEQAARALQQRGHPEFYVLDGGFIAWEAGGFPIVVKPGESKAPFVEPIMPEDLLRLIDAGGPVTILDLRAPDVYRLSRVPGAIAADTDAAIDRAVAGVAPTAVIVLYDDGSGGAREKAEALRRRGFRAVRYLHGGMLAWYEKNLRVER